MAITNQTIIRGKVLEEHTYCCIYYDDLLIQSHQPKIASMFTFEMLKNIIENDLNFDPIKFREYWKDA